MNPAIPRMRMFAGPNGSGKSTIKGVIEPELLGVYINPDDIEKEIRRFDFLDLAAYGVETTAIEVLPFFQQSFGGRWAGRRGWRVALQRWQAEFFFVGVNSYFASVTADFIRQKLLATRVTFTFETVMSHPDKIELLHKAQQNDYVATEDPEINISRVENRVKSGGHPVPRDKIIERQKTAILLPA